MISVPTHVLPLSAQQGGLQTTPGADLEATDLMLDAPRKTMLPRRAADELRTPGESLDLQPVRAGDAGRAEWSRRSSSPR